MPAPGQASDSMPDWLHQRARISPERLALISGEDRWTFAELERRVSSATSRLARAGVRAGDLVALLARNGSGFVQLVHAVPRAGAILVPLNVRLTASELAWQLSDADAACLVYDDPNAATAAELKEALPALACLSISQLCSSGAAEGAGIPPERVDLSAVHSVVYTSGTSGRPKGAMLTFGNHFWSAIGSALNLGLRNDDRWLACLPLFHVGGLAIVLRSVIYGTTAIVHESFDPEAANRAIDEDGVTIVSVVSAVLQRMLEARGDRPYPASLRCVLAGGGPVPQPLLEECARRGVPVVQTYGLTETASQAATLAPEEALRRPGSAGRPLFTTEIRIEDDEGQAARPGQPGEIVVRGPTVTPGYLNNLDATRHALGDGWLHTGDIGCLDADGYLFVLDRRDDLIISGGENVYPAEVEEVLRSHPAVRDAAVVGLADERWGQRVAAAIVARAAPELDEDELLAFCRNRLAAYKVPAHLRVVDELPHNAAGKLLRRALREAWPEKSPGR